MPLCYVGKPLFTWMEIFRRIPYYEHMRHDSIHVIWEMYAFLQRATYEDKALKMGQRPACLHP